LAAMAIPAFQKVRRQSFAKAMTNDARQIGAAFQQIYMATPATGPGSMPSVQAVINYVPTSGAISTGVLDPITSVDYLSQLVGKVGKGYAISASYGALTTTGAVSFTMSHPRVAPGEVSQNQSAGAIGTVVNFDSEGKPL